MATTLRKIISELDKTKEELESGVDWEGISSEFNLDISWSEDTRLKAYFIKRHYCTDTYVGIRVYFLDGELVAISRQSGRKADESFTFIDIESSRRLRDYLVSLMKVEETFPSDFIGEGLDEEIPETYIVEYNTQILQDTGFLNGEEVQIIKRRYPWEEKDKFFHTVEIKEKNGKKREIDCRTLQFKYNT
jgi:hypothetical protein